MVAKKQDIASDESPRADIVVKTDWGMVTSWDDVLKHFAPAGGLVDAAEAFGDGSELIDDKELLIGKAFVVLEWRYIMDEESGREYANILVMLRDGNVKLRFNDGSTGVYAQCKDHEEKYGKTGGILCRKGLRKSEYTKELLDGSRTKATTYYFS